MNTATENETTVLTVVLQPDEKLFKEKVETETKAINELKSQVAQIQTKINDSTGGKDEFQRKRTEIRTRLDSLQQMIEKLETERKSLNTKIEENNKKGQQIKADVTSMKKTIGFTTEDEIDKKINEIAHHMQTSTLSLKDEKKMMGQIQQLKNSKPLVGKYASMESVASSFEDGSIVPLRSRLDEIRVELGRLRDSKGELLDKQKVLVEERNNVTAPVKDLFDERSALYIKVDGHVAKRNELQREHETEARKFQAYQQSQKQLKAQKSRSEELKRAMDDEKQILEDMLQREDELPYTSEIQLVQQVEAYLIKITKPEGDVSKIDTKDSTTVAKNLEPDQEVLITKNKRDEEFFFAPKGKKTGVNKKNISKKASNNIKHEIGTLSYFNDCGVQAPLTMEEVPECLAKLKALSDEYTSKQSVYAEAKDKRRNDILAKLNVLNNAKKIAA